MKRKLQPGGNLFGQIKSWQHAYTKMTGNHPIRLSIGQPAGPAPLMARKHASEAIMSNKESMHAYQDNGSEGCPEFPENFLIANLSLSAEKIGVSPPISRVIPIPGIKPILIHVIMASRSDPSIPITVMTDTNPGYPTPKVMAYHLGCRHVDAEINAGNSFVPSIESIERAHKNHRGLDLIMMNRPHNPTGQIMNLNQWHEMCSFCETHGIRLFNDGAYTMLDHSGEHIPLSMVAPFFPNLSWGEAFSSSKLGNLTGWRIGLVTGSEDFMDDFEQIKGEVDSGHFAPAACGVNELVTKGMAEIEQVRKVYGERLKTLDHILTANDILSAVEAHSGFFTFRHVPKEAFGEKIQNGENFNRLMIEKTGIVGVHFGKYIRYSVSTCEFSKEEIQKISQGLATAKIKS